MSGQDRFSLAFDHKVPIPELPTGFGSDKYNQVATIRLLHSIDENLSRQEIVLHNALKQLVLEPLNRLDRRVETIEKLLEYLTK